MNLGAILLSRLNAQAAVSELRAAVRLEPNRPEASNMLGLGLATLSRNAEAIAEFELALRAAPITPAPASTWPRLWPSRAGSTKR